MVQWTISSDERRELGRATGPPGGMPGSRYSFAADHAMRAAMSHALDKLFATIAARKGSDPAQSYTAKLLAQGVEKCAKKFGEEATEAVIAAIQKDKTELAKESADVLYHLLVLWAASGITPEEVYAVLQSREGQSGLEEKATRTKS